MHNTYYVHDVCIISFLGFHEAVGDTIALSVSSPKHLRKIKLLGDIPDDAQLEINNLYIKVNIF